MADTSASFTQHNYIHFYFDKGKGHRLLNLQDFVDLSYLKDLSFCKVKLHCPVVLNSLIVSLSLSNVKVTACHKTGLIFRSLA